ncbi:hypothetical protein JI721_11735 [Alicyclobacillus cycloheptanicus]|uniref:Uncharacterized protein n=1 Tax=Alicyclobacillus cycloheptanicus TaxID=1457 RepID=A0ABT9XG09_9BACL|nr:hypothetical protein [Alicyclobacillus cycloheptanicus]MDQ0189210.1 hypothetical protein [Alicyclobacillus cycloheptanicus]WDM00395.1 hypothetical protein JI721_11735 [Alicyclobacillus cycloheptanicus]
MPNRSSSMQDQSPLSEAQDSVTKARHAVSQAQSHPSDQMVTQARNALDKAERAVAQAAQQDENSIAVDTVEDDLRDVSSDFQSAQVQQGMEE